MKKIFYLIVTFAVTLSGCGALVQTTVYQPAPAYNAPQEAYNPPPPAYDQPQQGYNTAYPDYDNSPQTEQVFYDELSPYGNWIDYPDYGYVWSPDVDSDFRPYATNGYWVYSDYGWTWASNYVWGWATFHYGRWFFDDNYGWLWMPGNEWAPAWVTWGSSNDYYCWAPLPPRVSTKEAELGWWKPNANAWNCAPARHMNEGNVTNYITYNNVTIVNNVRIISNSSTNYYDPIHRGAGNTMHNNVGVYDRGPQPADIERWTNSRVQTVTISDKTKPGAPVVVNNLLTIYRPAIKSNPQQAVDPVPRKIEKFRPQRQSDDQPANPPGGQPNNGRGTLPRQNGNQPANQQGGQPNNGQSSYPRQNGNQPANPQVAQPNNGQSTYPRQNGNQPANPQGSQPNNGQSTYPRQNGNQPANPQGSQPTNGQTTYPRQNGNQPANPQGSQPNNGQSTYPKQNGNQPANPQGSQPTNGQTTYPRQNGNQPANPQSNQPDNGKTPAQKQSGNQPANPPGNQPGQNPAFRPNLQPVQGQPNGKNNPQPGKKPKIDTAKRKRPANQ